MNYSIIVGILLSVGFSYVTYMYLKLRSEYLSMRAQRIESSVETTSSLVQSSVHCHGYDTYSRVCHFSNICYHPSEGHFVFFVGEDTVRGPLSEELSGGHFLALSSVVDFKGLMMSLMELPAEVSNRFNISWITEKSFIFSRFKPDNIMHVLHDDILPLLYTLNFLQPQSGMDGFNIRLVFMDDFGYHDSDVLFKTLSSYPLIYTANLTNPDSQKMVCFRTAHAGLSRTTVWYQYGFQIPQGPVQNSHVTSDLIHSAVNYLLNNLKCSTSYKSVGDSYLVLFSRKENRLILNENELMLEIMLKTNMKVVSISFEEYSLCDLVIIVRNSKGLISIHGSSLILSLFLKSKSIVIELFPYAVNPLNYTPFKTLANISGMGIIYKSWQNMDKHKTKGFPEREGMLGGISHLSHDKQKEILSQLEVPLHLCCDNPSWLYHIYQDTTVDVKHIAELCREAIGEASELKLHTDELNISPGPIKNLTCHHSMCSGESTMLKLEWETPWNLRYLVYNSFYYYILIQEVGSSTPVAYAVKTNKYLISKNVKCDTQYNVWVRVVLDDSRYSPFQYTMCIS